jgi:uncharacterized protein DUF11
MHRTFALLIALAALLVAAAPASADESGAAAATLSGSPDPVTAGTTIAYDTTFHNGAHQALPNTTLDAPAPAGFSITSVSSSGSCTTSSAEAICTYGAVPAGASVSATIIMNVNTSHPGDVSSSVTWTTNDGDDDSDDITLPAYTTVTVQAPSTDTVSEYIPPAGGAISTGSTTSASNPQSTTVDVPSTPNGVPASISEVDATGPQDACGPGATCVGQISVVTIPGTFSATDPLHLSFLLDSSELPRHFTKKSLSKLPMFHDGVAVPNCTGAAGVASPDPCVSGRKIIKPKHCKKGQFQVEIDVNSSTNGRWRP